MRYLFVLLFAFVYGYAHAEQNWTAQATSEFANVVGSDVVFYQSGPIHLFYTSGRVPNELEAVLGGVLDEFKDRLELRESIVFLGMSPLKAFLVRSYDETHQKLTNSTMIQHYASLVDDAYRLGGSSFAPRDGCVSRSGADGSSLTCYSGGYTTYSSRCTWQGDDLVCRSRSY